MGTQKFDLSEVYQPQVKKLEMYEQYSVCPYLLYVNLNSYIVRKGGKYMFVYKSIYYPLVQVTLCAKFVNNLANYGHTSSAPIARSRQLKKERVHCIGWLGVGGGAGSPSVLLIRQPHHSAKIWHAVAGDSGTRANTLFPSAFFCAAAMHKSVASFQLLVFWVPSMTCRYTS